jgi:hypothetical protein
MTPTRRLRPTGIPVPAAVLLLANLALVAACAPPAGGPGGSGVVLTGSESARPQDRLHQQAHDALARWADAVRKSGGATIAFVGDLTGQIGDWTQAEGDNNKLALMAGKVRAATDLPADTPPRDQAKWLDGSSVDVNVLSASATLQALVSGATATCDDCRALEVVGAQQATGLASTSRGPANVPIWVYSLRGSQVKITRVAVDESVTVDPPPWNASDPPQGLSVESAAGTEDSKKLTVTFIGAPDGADKRCGADYTAEAVESDLAVVIIINIHANPMPGACSAVGATRTAKVTLDNVLGKRAVLEIKQGLPVPVTAP